MSACETCAMPLQADGCDFCASRRNATDRDLTRHPLPGHTGRKGSDGYLSWRMTKTGAEVSIAKPMTFSFMEPPLSSPDMMMRFKWQAHDAAGRAGLILRRGKVDALHMEYVFEIRPGTGTYAVLRKTFGKRTATYAHIIPPTRHSSILPPGAWNILALTAYGPRLELYINRQGIMAISKADLSGTGVGIQAAADGAPARMTFSHLQIGDMAHRAKNFARASEG